MDEPRRAGIRRDALLWIIGLALAGAAVAVRNLSGLDGAPPGMYVDEASIGYNAWAIAHYGVDEHGYAWPLYFQAFGEYKNPVYVYALVPFLRVLPLTPAVERVPAALFGLIALLFVTLTAWRMSRSRWITALTLVLAAFTPWLTQESRVGFEVITMVAALCAAVWCVSGRTSGLRFAWAGVFLAVAVVGYSAGRVEVALFTILFILWFRRERGFWIALLPVAAMYAIVGIFVVTHPGALTAEFSVVNIGVDGAALPVLAGRFLANYVQYFSPDFLIVHGDPNLRHNTGYAGMLLVITAPLVLLGLWWCWRQRGRAFAGWIVTCLLVAPISGALTVPAPHALRGATMLPFLLALAIAGVVQLREVLTGRRVWIAAAAVTGVATVVQGGLYTADLFSAYPARAAAAFDTGVLPAVLAASGAAGGGEVYLSTSLDEEPYIDALMALLPPPARTHVDGIDVAALQALHVTVTDAATADQTARSGDVLVLAATDPPPPDGALVATERAPGAAGTPLVQVFRVQ